MTRDHTVIAVLFPAVITIVVEKGVIASTSFAVGEEGVFDGFSIFGYASDHCVMSTELELLFIAIDLAKTTQLLPITF